MDTIQSIPANPATLESFNDCREPEYDAFMGNETSSHNDRMTDSDSGSNNLAEAHSDTMVDTLQGCSSSIHVKKRGSAREPFSIRFVPVIDHSISTSLRFFKPIERRLAKDSVFRVGRVESYHEGLPKIEPVVFRSKVVSRLHAEIALKDGKWYVRDIQSSSGTFLNNTRLSPANKMSQDCPLDNGDVLQFGINFRGGHEEAFQCIKVRIELDYSWQHTISDFNVQSLNKVRQEMARLGHTNLLECTICLTSVRPGQPLFISACTHGWHYKCIRPLLVRTYPQFQCPNCRLVYDLEEEDDDTDNDLDENENISPPTEQ
ncbi:E3 ubiquitin-protein ligase DMA2 [Wickerhamiella sorbophila]|uniref:E3 ubiquitin-protein ligase DMA2 n=1 Tax=Wickerhamiella sorbophila TaxID=45607 RepID=A0A2T0FJX8_9ASCO|nr:E3 ubiquitin-protein ligase DMA2 [Wickerhamiella sorbophila]PRT55290.1 E3 ubiquitin-protein ligase DMA2 [Wickerhamiella sorbophila]